MAPGAFQLSYMSYMSYMRQCGAYGTCRQRLEVAHVPVVTAAAFDPDTLTSHEISTAVGASHQGNSGD
jgi:hypothetical protein